MPDPHVLVTWVKKILPLSRLSTGKHDAQAHGLSFMTAAAFVAALTVAHRRDCGGMRCPPPPGDVSALMQQLTDWLNADSDIHPVLISGLAQFQLVHIDPFVDGNGRTSRLLSTLCLYRRGYDFKRLFTLSEYYDRDRGAFYRAIQSVRENGMNLTLWLEYFSEGLAIQLEETKARGARAIKIDLLAKEHGLGDRQRSILVCCAESGEIGISDLNRFLPDVPRRTLQRDLKQLLDAGILIEAGETHQRRYSLKGKEL